MEQQAIVELRGITKSFSGVSVLKGVDLTLHSGEVVALMGENGAGKSTLMNILMGVHQADGGQIRIHGKEFQSYDIQTARENGIAIIPQELALVPALSVAENIFLSKRTEHRGAAVSQKEMVRKAGRILEELGFDIDPRMRVDQLPISYRQLVSIVKVVAEQASVVIMDEPTSSLSIEEVRRLQAIIRRMKERGVAIVYISHLLDEVFEIADTLIVLRDGHFIASKKKQETNQREIVSLMVGEDLMQTQQRLRSEIENEGTISGETLLEVEGLKLTPKAEPIDFTLHAGEVLGITGLVGAGKTELLRALTGLDKNEDFSMRLYGTQTKLNNMRDALNHGVGVVPEDRKLQGLVLIRSVRENIAMCRTYRKRTGKFGMIDRRRENADAAEMIQELVIKTAGTEQRVRYLSGGNQQKVVIAKELLAQPKILMLDEPTRGIDVGAKATIYQLISKLKKSGMGVLFFTSDMSEIPVVCDRVIVLSGGAVSGRMEGKDVTIGKILQYAAGGKE